MGPFLLNDSELIVGIVIPGLAFEHIGPGVVVLQEDDCGCDEEHRDTDPSNKSGYTTVDDVDGDCGFHDRFLSMNGSLKGM